MPIFDRAELADFWAFVLSLFGKNGIAPNSFNYSLSGRTITLSPGAIFINGYTGWETGDTAITIEAASGLTHRIIARLDLTIRTVSIIASNSATATPVKPIRNSDIYDLVIYTVTASETQTAILDGDITDNRADAQLCGYLCSKKAADSDTLAGLLPNSFYSATNKPTLSNLGVRSGTAAPADTLGVNGDIYIQY